MARRSYTTVVDNIEGLPRTKEGFSTDPVHVATLIPDTNNVAQSDSGSRNNNGKTSCLPCSKQHNAEAVAPRHPYKTWYFNCRCGRGSICGKKYVLAMCLDCCPFSIQISPFRHVWSHMLTLAFETEVIGVICCGIIDDNVIFLIKFKKVTFYRPSIFKS